MNKFLNLNRIEFFVTNQCTSNCKHCHVLYDIEKGVLPIEKAKLTLDLAIRNHKIESVLVFGGEPLLYPHITCEILNYANSLNIPTRQIITNCFWTKNKTKIDQICYQLKESTANNILVSVDYFHQEYLDFEIVKYTIEKICDQNIENVRLHPCWYESPTGKNKYDTITRKYLSELSFTNLPVSDGNILFPSGKSVINFKEKFEPLNNVNDIYCGKEPYSGRPDNIDALAVGPNGRINVCGIESMDIENFFQNYDPYKDQIMNIFLNEGIGRLLEIAKENKITFDINNYYSPCEACTELRGKLKNVVVAT